MKKREQKLAVLEDSALARQVAAGQESNSTASSSKVIQVALANIDTALQLGPR
jgi:hypothetical protein